MRHITEGVNAIEKSVNDSDLKVKKNLEIFSKANPETASTEIEALIEDVIISVTNNSPL